MDATFGDDNLYSMRLFSNDQKGQFGRLDTGIVDTDVDCDFLIFFRIVEVDQLRELLGRCRGYLMEGIKGRRGVLRYHWLLLALVAVAPALDALQLSPPFPSLSRLFSEHFCSVLGLLVTLLLLVREGRLDSSCDAICC